MYVYSSGTITSPAYPATRGRPLTRQSSDLSLLEWRTILTTVSHILINSGYISANFHQDKHCVFGILVVLLKIFFWQDFINSFRIRLLQFPNLPPHHIWPLPLTRNLKITINLFYLISPTKHSRSTFPKYDYFIGYTSTFICIDQASLQKYP